MSTLPGRIAAHRSPVTAERHTDFVFELVVPPCVFALWSSPCDCRSFTAFVIVFCVAMQAFRFTSVARARTSRRPRISEEFAVRKARTTPEPEPTSRRVGDGDGDGDGEELKRDFNQADSEAEERVSRKR